jgi:hypothetical protein
MEQDQLNPYELFCKIEEGLAAALICGQLLFEDGSWVDLHNLVDNFMCMDRTKVCFKCHTVYNCYEENS